MKPFRPINSNVVFVLDGCNDLPGVKGTFEDGTPYIETYWTPNAEELAALNAGLPIKLSFLGTTLPPSKIEVDC